MSYCPTRPARLRALAARFMRFTGRMPRTLQRAGAVFLATGVLVLLVDQVLSRAYSTDQAPPRLPPAGEFLGRPGEFSFAVLGDTRGNIEAFRKAMRLARSHDDVQFILHTGDIAKRLQRRYFEWLLRQIDDELGEFPIYVVPGNHDIVHSSDPLPERTRAFHRAFGQAPYWFSWGEALFVVLNNGDMRLDAAERRWLDEALTRMRPSHRYCFVVMHAPPRDPIGEHGSRLRTDHADALEAILERHRVDAVISGHLHSFCKGKIGCVPIYVSGSAGQEYRPPAKGFSYLVCRVGGEEGLVVENREFQSGKSRGGLGYYLATRYRDDKPWAMGFVLILLGAAMLARPGLGGLGRGVTAAGEVRAPIAEPASHTPGASSFPQPGAAPRPAHEQI